MRYVVRAIKNPCGGVEGGYHAPKFGWVYNIYKSKEWMEVKREHGYVSINDAYRYKEDEDSRHRSCGCVFVVEELGNN